MRIYSWNVNGYRAIFGKESFLPWLEACQADVVCLQEIKTLPEQLAPDERAPAGFEVLWNGSTVKKGYSGVATFMRNSPLAYGTGLPDARFQGEGRLNRTEFAAFHLLNVYFPNGQKDETRLRYKLDYYDAFLDYAQELRRSKPVVVCGDFNTAHQAIDLARPKENANTSGFLPVERAWMDRFVSHGYVDCFRLFDPGPQRYTWWSFRAGARRKNVGWRIDYFFVSEELRDAVRDCWIEAEVMGSDHCPVGLDIEA